VSREIPERAELVEGLLLGGRALSAATIMFHQAVADRLGLNPTDHKCADLLLTRGPLTAGELAELTGLTTGAITGVIDRLERGGFVRREDDPADRRRVIVRAVPKRLREIGRLFEDLAARMAELCGRYTAEELAVILDYMTRCHDALHAATLALRRPGRKRGKGAAAGPPP
jgi:DNA-binding MarR family transcriptional regulator